MAKVGLKTPVLNLGLFPKPVSFLLCHTDSNFLVTGFWLSPRSLSEYSVNSKLCLSGLRLRSSQIQSKEGLSQGFRKRMGKNCTNVESERIVKL